MTNREKYADILATIQAESPNNKVEELLGLTRDTKQPVSCQDMDCEKCAWASGRDCTQLAREWLNAPTEGNNVNKREEENQMKKKYMIDFDGNLYHLLLSKEQLKVFYFLADDGWEITVEELEDDFKEL